MGNSRIKEKLIDHLKKVGFDDERIEKILSIIPIEEAYENLWKNEVLKKVINRIGIDEVERRAKNMRVTIDVFAKEYDRWNDVSGISLVSRTSEEERAEFTNQMFDLIIKRQIALKEKIKSKISHIIKSDEDL